ncbi:MAG: glycosyltransferase family 39 protein [Deltaproteobacteria bacterium]|nr:glycosyltransferase family 39 protein [Deltaproteobacteria bacterium]
MSYKKISSNVLFLLIPLISATIYWLFNPDLDWAESVLGFPFGDSKAWFEKAIWIKDGKGINDSHRPMFSILLANWFLVFPATYFYTKLFTVFLFTLTGFSLGIVLKISLGFIPALMGVLFYSLSDGLIQYSLIPQSELGGALFSFFFLYAFMYSFSQDNKKNWFLAGVLLALATLCRPLILVCLPLWVLTIFIKTKTLKNILYFIIGINVLLIPWLVRQKYFYNVFSISTSMTENLYAASDTRYGKWSTKIFDDLVIGFENYDVKQKNIYFFDLFKENIINYPTFYFKNILHKTIEGLSIVDFDVNYNIFNLLQGLLVLVLIAQLLRLKDLRINVLIIYIFSSLIGLSIFGMNGKTSLVDMRVQLMYIPIIFALIAFIVLNLFDKKYFVLIINFENKYEYIPTLKKILFFICCTSVFFIIKNIFFSKSIFEDKYFLTEKNRTIVQSEKQKYGDINRNNLIENSGKIVVVSGWITHPIMAIKAYKESNYPLVFLKTENFDRQVFILNSKEVSDVPVIFPNISNKLNAYDPVLVVGRLKIDKNYRSTGFKLYAEKIYNLRKGSYEIFE